MYCNFVGSPTTVTPVSSLNAALVCFHPLSTLWFTDNLHLVFLVLLLLQTILAFARTCAWCAPFWFSCPVLGSDPAEVCRSHVIKLPMATSCFFLLWKDCHRLLCLNVGPPNLLHLLCAQLTAMVSVPGYITYLTRTSSIQWYVCKQVQSTRNSWKLAREIKRSSPSRPAGGAGGSSEAGCMSWNSVLSWLAAWNGLVGRLVESSHGSAHCATAVTGSFWGCIFNFFLFAGKLAKVSTRRDPQRRPGHRGVRNSRAGEYQNQSEGEHWLAASQW